VSQAVEEGTAEAEANASEDSCKMTITIQVVLGGKVIAQRKGPRCGRPAFTLIQIDCAGCGSIRVPTCERHWKSVTAKGLENLVPGVRTEWCVNARCPSCGGWAAWRNGDT
jgi:ribosomal protein L37E